MRGEEARGCGTERRRRRRKNLQLGHSQAGKYSRERGGDERTVRYDFFNSTGLKNFHKALRHLMKELTDVWFEVRGVSCCRECGEEAEPGKELRTM